MAKKSKTPESYLNIPEEYYPVIDDFVIWLDICSYEPEQIIKICNHLVEFIHYLVKKNTKLDNITDEFMHNFYIDALKKAGLPDIPPQYKPSMNFIISRQDALHAFSRFIIGVGKEAQNQQEE